MLAAVLVACAKVGPPAGGPVDRTPLRVVDHRPAADATGVGLDAPVEILFSESMERRRTEEALFVSPESRVRPSWRGGKRLVLDMELLEGRTYVITVGTGARDLRGNALEQSFTLAFATGPHLNQGCIQGRAFREHQPASGAYVWAYDLEGFSGRMGDPPQYRTQTGRDGGYEFSRLAAARYRVLAFVDENRNRKYDEGEYLGLPAGDLGVGEEDTTRAGDLALVQHVRPRVKVQRVQAVDQRRVLLQFSAPVAAEQLEVGFEGLAVEGLYISPQDRRRAYARTSLQERGEPYFFSKLKLDGQPLEWEEPVRGSGRTDRTRPELVDRFPQEREIAPDDTLKLIFSEGMETGELEDFWVESDSTYGPEGTWRWPNLTTLGFVPAAPFVPGSYRLQGRGDLLRDLNGMALEDSVIVFQFRVVEQLGWISGRILGGQPIRVTAQCETRTYGAAADSAGRFVLEGLVPGVYTVFAFIDRDGDGAHHAGRLEPFAPAEPYCHYPQSVSLTEGEEIAEIDFQCR